MIPIDLYIRFDDKVLPNTKTPWLKWSEGQIYTKWPDTALYIKMLDVAHYFSVNVQDDESVIYSRKEDWSFHTNNRKKSVFFGIWYLPIRLLLIGN